MDLLRAASARGAPDLLGLGTDDGQDLLVARSFRNGGEYVVECLSVFGDIGY
jgi:hypothetical protein